MMRRGRRPLFAVGLAGAAGCALAAGSTAAAPAANGDVVNGARVYAYWCAPCHARGPGHPGTQSLAIKYRGTDIPAALEDRDDLSPPVTAYFVRRGVALMPPFRKTEISEAELQDLAAYLAKGE